MSWRAECGVLAITLGVTAALLPVWQGTGTSVLINSLLLHAASVTTTLPLLIPQAKRSDGDIAIRRVMLLLLLAAAIPPFGVVTVCCLYLGRQQTGRLERLRHYGLVTKPLFRDLKAGEERQLRTAERADQLLHGISPAPDRLKALLSTQNMAPRATANLLRHVLGDDVEDMRLLAYGILDQHEKEISKRIEKISAQQRNPGTPENWQAGISRELAELYWELVYQRLVQGGVRTFCIEQVMHHATAALRHNADDAGLWLLLGKAKILAKNYAGAAAALNSATSHGMLSSRVTPYLAELAFQKGDHAIIRRLFAQPLSGLETTAAAPASYWSFRRTSI